MNQFFFVATVCLFSTATVFWLLAALRRKSIFVWTAALLVLTGFWLMSFFRQGDVLWLGLARENARQAQVFLTLLLLSGAMLFGRSALAFVLYPKKPFAKLQQSLLLLACSGVLGSILSLSIAELSRSGYDSNGVQLIVWLCSLFALAVIIRNLKRDIAFFLPLVLILPSILLSKVLAVLNLLDADVSLLISGPALVLYLSVVILVRDQRRLVAQEKELSLAKEQAASYKATIGEKDNSLLALKDHLDQGRTREQDSGFLTVKGITDLLSLELNRYQRYRRIFSVLSIGLDKQVDLSHLQKVFESIKRGLRASDHCGAMGESEFLVLLTETELAQAMYAAEKFRQFLFEAGVSVSIGVAAIRDEGMDLFRLLQEAEDSRERAHQAGGNRAAMTSQGIVKL